MDSRPIAFFDSGIGGLPYLEWAKRRLPAESFVYLADSAHFPYGEKPADIVRTLVVESVGRLLLRVDPKVVVVACNTASVVALETLRSEYPIPFIGVVPAVKPAASSSPSRRIGLLATSRTVGDVYLENLIDSYAPDCTIVRIAAKNLVEFVENDFIEGANAEEDGSMCSAAEEIRRNQLDTIVLGCTHFTFLDEAFGRVLGPGVAIVDSRDGVGRRLMSLLVDEAIEGDGKCEDRLYHSGGSAERYRAFAERFGLAYAGILE